MSKKPKLSHIPHTNHRPLGSRSGCDNNKKLKTTSENRSAMVAGTAPHEWQRCREGFQMTADKHEKGTWNQRGHHNSVVTSNEALAGQQTTPAKSKTRFGQKWIQSEELLSDFNMEKSGQGDGGSASVQGCRTEPCTSTTSDGSNNQTAKDKRVDVIQWSESDSESDTEKSQKQNNPCVSKITPTKKTVRVSSKPCRKTCRNRKTASRDKTVKELNWQPGDKSSENSDSNNVISASESDDERQLIGQHQKSLSVSKDPSPVLEIQCIGSPDHNSSFSSDETSIESHADLAEYDVSRQKLESPCRSPEVEVTSISSCVSSQSGPDSEGSPGQAGLKASEWVRKVKWEVTPTKQRSHTPPGHADSGKKKKKFVKGGLAEQMSRILLREKSASHVWQHQCRPDNTQQDCKSLTVRVHSIQTVFSLQLADCSVIDPNPSSSWQHPDTPQCSVLFSPLSTQCTAAVQPGSSVRIHPPWQQLKTSAGGIVLLCARCVVTNQTSAASDQHCVEVPGHDKVGADTCLPRSLHPTCRGRWLCPCSTDKQPTPSRCPAHLFPFLPASLLQCVSTMLPGSKEASSACGTLHTVTENSGGTKKVLTFDTLLESIERSHSKGKILPGFLATVLRVFREQEGTSTRSSLLVEDSQGTVAMVTGATNDISNIEGQLCSFSDLCIRSRTNADRDPVLFSAIAAAWSDRAKTGAASQDSGGVALSNDSFNNSQCLVQPPGFCYLLEVNQTEGGQDWLRMDPSSTPQQPQQHRPQQPTLQQHRPQQPRPLTVTSLAHALQFQQQNIRVTLLVKVIYHCPENCTPAPEQHSGGDDRTVSALNCTPAPEQHSGGDDRTVSALLFVCDHSLLTDKPRAHCGLAEAGGQDALSREAFSSPGNAPPGYVKIRVQEDCVADPATQESLRLNNFAPYLLLLRDVWYINGTWIVDKYSTLASLDRQDEETALWRSRTDPDLCRLVRDCDVLLPPVSSSTLLYSLVCMSGVIQGVDEKSAYTWEECDKCGSDQLAAKSSAQPLVCLRCQKAVRSPVQRMTMEVTVCVDGNPCLKVNVKLLQSTIQNLLPAEENEEGYDVDCVLHKRLGPVNCAITSMNQNVKGVTFTAVQLPS